MWGFWVAVFWYVFDEITKRKKEVKMDGKATCSWAQRWLNGGKSNTILCWACLFAK
jgi:hypothetical protein